MAKQAQYDPTIIQTFAAKLYSRANSIVATYTLFGLLIGLGIGFVIGRFVSSSMVEAVGATELIIGAIPGAIGGYFIGMERSFALRLQAQTALCQVAIEQNTRAQAQYAYQAAQAYGSAPSQAAASPSQTPQAGSSQDTPWAQR